MKMPVAMMFALIAMPAAIAHASVCPAPTQGTTVAVPGHPFAITATDDNCLAFVSLETGKNRGAIAVLRNDNGRFDLARTVEVEHNVFGASLIRNGGLLAVAAGDDTVVFDVADLARGDAKALRGTLHNGTRAGAIYTAVDKDDKLLFVSEEDDRRVSVFSLDKVRSGDFGDDALLGHVRTAAAPVGLAVSPDGRWLYATNEVGPPSSHRSAECEPEMARERKHGQGLLVRIDIAKAANDPTHATADALLAGCNPVRVATSPSGKEIWVSARGDDRLLRFQVGDWLAGSGSAATQKYEIGAAPIGVAVRPDGKQVWTALSNRFGRDKNAKGELAGLALGADGAVSNAMSAPAKGFPRELIFLADGRTLVATLFDAQQVEFIPTPD